MKTCFALMKSAFGLMKTAVTPPNEAKSPTNSHFSHYIPSLAQRLHFFISPVGGDFIAKNNLCPLDKGYFLLEATPGIEPGNQSFADSCLTAWLCRRNVILSALNIAD